MNTTNKRFRHVTCLETTLRAGRSVVQTPVWKKFASLLQAVQTVAGACPASESIRTRDHFTGVKRPERATDYSPQIPRLIMRRAVALLPPYDFMAGTRTILPSDIQK